MNQSTSKLASSRQNRKHQVNEQRDSILDAAEKLFLQNGLENTRMIDIAIQAGITKITLYRYFPNRDVIALEIQARMIKKIASLVDPIEPDVSQENTKKLAQSMISRFNDLRDAYRYMGMFDQLYLDHLPDAALARWTKSQLNTFPWIQALTSEVVRESPSGSRFVMVLNTVTWFLEKLALRGELTWSDQAVPMEEHLKLFEEMIMGYIDRFGE